MPTISNLRVTLGLDGTRFEKGLRSARAKLRSFGVAATAATAVLGAIGLKGLQSGDNIAKAATRAGVATDAFDAINFSAQQSDVSVEQLQKGFVRMQRSVGDAQLGLKAASDAFGRLGIDLDAFGALKPQEQFGLLADALNDVNDQNLRFALGAALFGGIYQKLIPLLKLGSAGFQENADLGAKLGIIYSKDLAQGAEGALDAFARLNAVMDNFGRIIASTLGSDLTFAIDGILNFLPGALAAVRAVFVTLGTALAGVARTATIVFDVLTGNFGRIPELVRSVQDTLVLTASAYQGSIDASVSRIGRAPQIALSETQRQAVLDQVPGGAGAARVQFGTGTVARSGVLPGGAGARADTLAPTDDQIRLLERIALAVERERTVAQ